MRTFHRLYRPLLALAALVCLDLTGCTAYHATGKLAYSRQDDTLAVGISPEGQPRWDPTRDSLVINCTNCDPDNAQMIERFDDGNSAVYEIDPSANLNLQLTYMGTVQSIDIPGIVDTSNASTTTHHRLQTRHRTPVAAKEPPKPAVDKAVEVTAAKPEKPATPERPKTARSVKVTALEGVAVYKDKSKTEVLKIVQPGTNLALIAREGDLFSVSIDGQEGFVEAEAVQVNE